MSSELRVSAADRSGWTVVRAEGEIDIAFVSALEQEVERALESGGKQILFDLGSVSFMDSTGLRALVSSHHRLSEQGGRIAVVTGNGPVRRLLEVSGLEQSLPVYGSLDDALAS